MKSGFSAWQTGMGYYIPLILVGLVVFGVFRAHGWAWLGAIVFLAGLFSLFFFRDPVRLITAGPREIVSPADGAVVGIEDLENTPYYNGPCKRVSIFLSVFDVHVNRAPATGTVTAIRHQDGGYVNALRADSSEKNESHAGWMDTECGPRTVRQISGAVARRIVCVPVVGDNLEKGEKFGMIKFGSRTELYLPPEADVLVKLKDTVRAGATIMAQFS